MLGTTLALVAVVLGCAPAPDPADLVNQLGSPRFALRESAEGELTRLGRKALPALKAAKDSRDPEIRTRVSAILSRIENTLLLQATPIQLDFQDASLPAVIESIGRQSGSHLSLSPDEASIVVGRRLTLQSPEPVPFWKAIDTVCSAAGLQHRGADPASPGGEGMVFSIQDNPDPLKAPASDSGPFRVSLNSVHLQSEVQLGQPHPVSAPRVDRTESNRDTGRTSAYHHREFFLQLLLVAEPRISVSQNGAVKLAEVIDDRDQSLLNPPASGVFQQASGYFGIHSSPAIRLRVDLHYPASPGQVIRLIRGAIPVIVTARKPDPMAVSIAESVGKSFRADEVDLTLVDYKPARNNVPATLQLAIKPLGHASQPVDAGIGEPLGYRVDPTPQQIEILDDRGRPISWFPSSTFYNGDENRLTMTVGAQGSGTPTTLRFHGIQKVCSEIPFEFRDVPIP